MITSIVAAVVILGVLIVVHEAGHFAIAKRCGVRVLRFSIGYPPKIFGVRRGETEYAIGATPLGGYVRMLGDEIGDEMGSSDIALYLTEIGEDLLQAAARQGAAALTAASATPAENQDPLLGLAKRLQAAENAAPAQGSAARQLVAQQLLGRPLREDEEELLEQTLQLGSGPEAIKFLSEHRPLALTRQIEKRAFPSQPLAKRFAIVLAGPCSNILFAPILLAIVFMYGVPQLLPVLGQAKAGLPAAVAGLRVGDRVLSINGHAVPSWEDLSTLVKQSGGAPLTFKLARGKTGEIVTTTLKPTRETEPTGFGDNAPQWVIGVMPRGDASVHREGPVRASVHAVLETGRMTGLLVVGIGKLFAGSTPLRQALGGPIMIAQIAGREARQGFASVALFTVMLSLELGIINLLPVPMLDGGHLLFFVIEGLRGKPLKVRHREIAQQVGLFLLVILMAFVIFNDISRIVQG